MADGILIVGPDVGLGDTLRRLLDDGSGTALSVERVETVAAADARARRRDLRPIGAAICDQQAIGMDDLPFLAGLEARVPVVVLVDPGLEHGRSPELPEGSRDYVSRDRLDDYWFPKFLRSVIHAGAARFGSAQADQSDVLTGLPNRALLHDRLDHAIAMARRHRTRRAVFFVDIDRFKHINDSLGHAAGDALLRATANRLRGCVRQSDTVSRLAGDEFVLVLDDIAALDDVGLIADKILIAMNAPYPIDGRELHVTVSMGISIYPDDGQDADAIIRNADIAMYHAKEAGRNSYQFFRTQMNVRAIEQQSLERDLRRALERGEFELRFQPKVDLSSGERCGVEALVRWRHPAHGIVMPGSFIPVAEESGLIVPIGRWVLHEACRQASEWIAAGCEPMALAVNISAVELRSKDFIAGVRAVLRDTGLPPETLELELTETALIQSSKTADLVLREIKDMGVRIALDDFGTGYSSLSLLKRFPVDTLKIDHSFIHDMTTDPGDATIVRAVIAMARSLNRNVVAEGVETREQLRMLRVERCAQGQGYLFGRPATAAEFMQRATAP
jgi:diguanylate cyclase (GGDEF)-like protein